MKTVASAALTALDAGSVYFAQLIEIAFHGGAVVRLNTSNYNLEHDGDTYTGAYGLGTISPVRDSVGQVQGLQFELAATTDATIALALDGADQWQGATVTLMNAIVSATDLTVLDAPVEWTGSGDTFTVRETADTAVVVASAESSQVDLLRGSPLTYSHADQQLVAPGDRFFEYVNAQADKPVIWPAKEWFYK